jgi:iron-sulfur cluster repair protein YtfE (RIC family)
MKPSEVRQRILDDHAALRRLLADVQQTLGAAAPEPRALRALGDALRQRFAEHLALEERTLVPALRAIDAWGEERAGRLEREHREQRARLDAIVARLQQEAGAALAADLRGLAREILLDMEHEEKTVLDENLLRDDVITTDVEAG